MKPLNLTKIKQLFGTFDYVSKKNGSIKITTPNWIKDNIVRLKTPIIPTIYCHKKIAPQLAAALYKLHIYGPKNIIRKYNGCFVPRHMRWSNNSPLSHHSWGIAIDLNASLNPYGKYSEVNKPIADIFEEFGFCWGGTWSPRYADPMHFEAIKIWRPN